MIWAMWALVAIYGVSLLLLACARLISRRSRLFRRFLIGEPADGDWRHDA